MDDLEELYNRFDNQRKEIAEALKNADEIDDYSIDQIRMP